MYIKKTTQLYLFCPQLRALREPSGFYNQRFVAECHVPDTLLQTCWRSPDHPRPGSCCHSLPPFFLLRACQNTSDMGTSVIYLTFQASDSSFFSSPCAEGWIAESMVYFLFCCGLKLLCIFVFLRFVFWLICIYCCCFLSITLSCCNF